MTLFSTQRVLALLAMALSVVAVPSTASASGSIHLDLPGFSIGFHDHDRRYYKKRHKRYKRHYRHHRNHYRHPGRYYDRYYDGHYYQPRRYYYYDGYRSRGSRYRDHYDDYCPTPGFSRYYYRNRGCYAHGDHYHCDD